MPETNELGPCSLVEAESIGQPGQRRFRLKAMNDDGEAASIWMEKEQLVALGEALENVLREEQYEYTPLPLDDLPQAAVFPLSPSIDFRAAQLSMGVNRDTRRIILIGTDGDEDDATSVSFEFDYRRGAELRRQVTDVAAAGRPPCPLCSAPLDPSGHVCPRSNGHHAQG
ncbi:MAG: DUF3090 family protein [Dehalococcoidia bacterium]|nr:DUF3090 family protein [Dehalococcoidia bacterium]